MAYGMICAHYMCFDDKFHTLQFRLQFFFSSCLFIVGGDFRHVAHSHTSPAKTACIDVCEWIRLSCSSQIKPKLYYIRNMYRLYVAILHCDCVDEKVSFSICVDVSISISVLYPEITNQSYFAVVSVEDSAARTHRHNLDYKISVYQLMKIRI